MRPSRDFSFVITVLLMVSIAACASTPTPGPATTAPLAPTATPAAPAATPAPKNFEDFNPDNFSQSVPVTNQWLPMTPGLKFVYEGTTVEDDGTSAPHRVEIHFTDLTKVIAGIRTTVSWDLDFSNGQLVEAELAFFAQDNDGNVWRMGEYPEEYEDGEIVASPAWIHGLQDAHAGIMMLADPQPGTPSYSEGWAPRVGWTDRGQVDQVGQKKCVGTGECYENVLVIAETSQTEPGAFQLKFYAPNVGNVYVDWKGADQTQETLDLVKLEQLSPEALADVRAQAIELEKSAYEHSPDVYAFTLPMEYPAGTPVLAMATAEPRPTAVSGSEPLDIIVYASDLALLPSALFELDVMDDAASPGGQFIGLPNNGDELDPPPESDPHATFTVQVQSGLPYRCWIHMKVGEPFGVSQANLMYAQFTDAVDEAGQEILNLGTSSYLSAEGPTQPGWAWVECDRADSEAEPLVYFKTSGEVTVRLQAGAEGVGFDQFVLSPDRFLKSPPVEAIVEK